MPRASREAWSSRRPEVSAAVVWAVVGLFRLPGSDALLLLERSIAVYYGLGTDCYCVFGVFGPIGGWNTTHQGGHSLCVDASTGKAGAKKKEMRSLKQDFPAFVHL